jgi:hypothetical protein
MFLPKETCCVRAQQESAEAIVALRRSESPRSEGPKERLQSDQGACEGGQREPKRQQPVVRNHDTLHEPKAP